MTDETYIYYDRYYTVHINTFNLYVPLLGVLDLLLDDPPPHECPGLLDQGVGEGQAGGGNSEMDTAMSVIFVQ